MSPGDVLYLLSALTHKPSVASVKVVANDQNTTSGTLINITDLSGFRVRNGRKYVFFGYIITDSTDNDITELALNAPGTPSSIRLNVIEFDTIGSDATLTRVSEATADDTVATTSAGQFLRHIIIAYLSSGASGSVDFRFKAQTGGGANDVTVQEGSWVAMLEVAV